ncbi:MAG: UDP-N-acetylmuramoyl-tripeptide--D-alanyl-D-alanine ligase [Endomicrobium sp.]|jgi:UDP-N-acetylmuramoyl-tripeptide--D-alanyl-D-alanine ligase|nr:UDP-N-acetylmuramoyl-tripeptide--D-alanyl-D-alanine ligase [Endomicrobium sp.]
MEILRLIDLIHAVNGKFITGNPYIPVNGVSIDSRTIHKGEVYFAIQGRRCDGHDFIKEAVGKGASAVIYSKDNLKVSNFYSKFPSLIKTDDTVTALGKLAKYYRNKFKNINIVGITGSNGKTTTKEILASILSGKGKTLSNRGNLNNRIGLPISIFNLTSEYKYAVFEMGTSVYGEIGILSGILMPDLGLITNIGFSHLESFVSPDGVFKEKKILLENVKENGCVVINNDDRFLRTVNNVDGRKIITFGLYNHADVTADNVKVFSDQTVFDICFNNERLKVSMPVCAKFNVSNALAASACALYFGLSLNDIKTGIELFVPPKMRMETVSAKNGTVLINDAYNANPSSMKNSIEAVLQSYPGKEINLVLGDMLELGVKADRYHLELGKFIAAKKINSVNLFGSVIFNAKAGLGDRESVFYSRTKDELLDNLKNICTGEKTVFLFKGSRGMKLEEVFAEFYEYLDRIN